MRSNSSAIHSTPSSLAGKTVKVKAGVHEIGGEEYRVEDWWDRVSGGVSWMDSDGNPACLKYAMRSATSTPRLPLNNEVLYGKVGPFGHLLHLTEIEGN